MPGNINRLPPGQDEPDTDPEPFGKEVITAKRCYQCGRDQADTFEAGKTWTIKAMRKWLHTRMTGSEAIAVMQAFVRDTGCRR